MQDNISFKNLIHGSWIDQKKIDLDNYVKNIVDIKTQTQPKKLKKIRKFPIRKKTHPDLLIVLALTVGKLFKFSRRESESFLTFFNKINNFQFKGPNHSTISRRSKTLKVNLTENIYKIPRCILIENSGIDILNKPNWIQIDSNLIVLRKYKNLKLSKSKDFLDISSPDVIDFIRVDINQLTSLMNERMKNI